MATKHTLGPDHVFFTERLERAIAGKEPQEQLTIIEELKKQAERDKQAGYGPPQDEITAARRKWLRIYDEHLAPVLIDAEALS